MEDNTKKPGHDNRFKKDLWLLGGFLLLGAILCAFLFLRRKAGGEAASVSVTIDGELVGIYALSRDLELPIETKYGRNLLVIKDGTASVAEADCPDGICVMEHPVSRTGEMIVCLPHHLVIEVIPEGVAPNPGTGGIDAVAGG